MPYFFIYLVNFTVLINVMIFEGMYLDMDGINMLEKKLIKIFCIFTISVLLTACVNNSAKERWRNFDDQTINYNIGSDDAGLVFYRTRIGKLHTNTAINVLINGEYQTSLQEGGSSQIVVCAQPQRLKVFISGRDNSYINKLSFGDFYNPPAGKVSYFRVILNNSGRAELTPVDKKTAETELKNIKRQSNVLSRVDKHVSCS